MKVLSIPDPTAAAAKKWREEEEDEQFFFISALVSHDLKLYITHVGIATQKRFRKVLGLC